MKFSAKKVSGHGSQITNKDGTESDGLDEGSCYSPLPLLPSLKMG